jgi:hypothetical protein
MLAIVMSLVAVVTRRFNARSAHGSVPRIKASGDFWLVPNYPASPIIITT